MARRPKPTKRRSYNKEESKMVKSIDSLAQYEQFVALIPPEIRKDILEGLKPNEILKKYSNIVAGRMVATAMTERDPTRAFAMMKDVLDRTEGKAIERKQIQHALHNVTDQEFDALLASELEDLDDLDLGDVD